MNKRALSDESFSRRNSVSAIGNYVKVKLARETEEEEEEEDRVRRKKNEGSRHEAWPGRNKADKH